MVMCFAMTYQDPTNIEGNAESARVVDLRPWMDYEFQVIASNILGSGEPSMPSQPIRTKQAGQRNPLITSQHSFSVPWIQMKLSFGLQSFYIYV